MHLNYVRRDSTSLLSAKRHVLIRIAMVLTLALGLSSSASAMPVPVCTVTDNSDSPSDTGSLRYCVNNAVSGEAIIFNSSLNGQTITLISGNGPLTIGTNLTIQGPGASLLTISGGNAVGVFQISSSLTVSISGLTIANGNANYGGGIYNSGTLTVSNSTFSENSATSDGGGIANGGTVTVNNSTFSGNTASIGGTIYNFGTLTVSNSTFSGNTATYGGGIFNSGNLGTQTVSNSTFSGNSAIIGGGIFNGTGGGTKTVSNSILLSGDTCSGTGCPTNGSSGNVVGGSVNLLPLGNYGGPTQTMLPLPGSPAICAGSDALAVAAGVTTDQRGFPLNSSCVDAGAVQSNYLTVTTASDVTDGSPDCASGSGTTCSLRDAMTEGNTAGYADIAFASALNGGTITQASALPAITGQMNLIGPGAKNLTVSGNHSTTVGSLFTVNSDAEASLYGLTVANGNAFGVYGGGIVNGGTLAVSNSTLSGNSASYGGGIYVGASGMLTLSNSTVSGNSATHFGGGIVGYGTLTVSNSIVSGNSATDFGGGIVGYGTLTVSNSTVSGNSATDFGGGIFGDGTLTVSNSTVSGNSANLGGGGIWNGGGALTLSDSIVAGNTATAGYADIYGGYTDNLGNQASDSSSPTSTIAINLAPLGNYGGPTQTMVPLPGSPAICAGLAANILAGVTTDQRGYPKTNTTYTGYSSGSPCVDSGAVQSQYTSVQFVQQPTSPLVNSAISPSPTVEVLETNTNLSTNNTDAVNGIPITLSYSGGSGEISGTLTETTAGGVATFGGLTPNTVGTGFDFSTSVTVLSGTTLTATSNSFNVNPTTVQVTVGTSPAGLSFSVDGTPYTTTQTPTWAFGSPHTLTTTAAQSGAGTQYSFTGWSDGTLNTTDSVTASTATTSYTAEFNPSAYVLNVSSSNTSYGTVTAPASSGGYYTAGTPVTLTAVANAGYFSGWTGSADITSPSSASTTITMNGPETVKANFAPILSYVVTTATDDATGTASNCNLGYLNEAGTLAVLPQRYRSEVRAIDCSLRDALAAATAAGAGSVTFSSSAFPSATTIQLTSGLNLPSNTTITGPTTGSGATLTNLVTVRGGGSSNQFSVFTVNSGVTGAAIANLIISNGNGNAGGGGIDNQGALTVTNSTVSGNSAVAGNYQYGGGIYNNGGTLIVSNSTFSGNSAEDGGGILSRGGGTLTVSNSTFSGNSANSVGGGIYFQDGTVTVSNSTVSGNSAGGYGGGIGSYNTLTLSNSIVAGNTATGSYADTYGIYGTYTDNGGNQASNSSSPTSTIPINLAPLGNYGGPTQTMVPLPGSPAICAGLAANILTGVTTDQRGYPNRNTTYTGYSSGSPCVDSGAVQSNYSLSFTTEPSPIPPATAILPNTNFQAAVTLAESGSAFTAASESIPLTLTGTGTLSNGTASTASGVASYSTLQVSAAGTGDKLTATLAVTGSASVSATSNGFNVATPATMTTPTAGSTLGTTDVTFTWSAGVGVTAYELVLGTTGFGSHDLYNSGLITTTTATVSSIPADLLTVYVRLCSKISGVLSCNNYTYTEAGTATPATMTTPTGGSTLGTTNVQFTWGGGVGATAYELILGTKGFGTYDLYNSGLVTATNATVASLPADLLTVYARLCSKISGVLSCNNYTYTEAGTGTPTPATMTTPISGSTLGTTNVQFTWGGGVGVTAYELVLGTKGFGSYDLYNSGLVTATNATVASLPANGVKVYARLCSEISGALSCNNYTYTEQ